MSKFFNVTLDSDVVLDDNSINTSSGWSSQKILDEIVRNRIGKFEELSDVDVVNRKDSQVVTYSGATGKFTTIDIQTIGDAAGLSLKQITKMGVTGTTTTPQTIEIPISTVNFNVPKVNVLKFQLGDQNVIKTENGFLNSEINDFLIDEMILFDGTAHLKTSFQSTMNYDGDIDTYKSYSVQFDKSLFKSLSDISVSDSGTNKILNITAIPFDRLLIPVGDLNLSNVSNIDYFNIAATGSNIRVVCSVDSGATWKTFNGTQWVNINLNIDDVKANGIIPSSFNVISSTLWNLLVTTNKIRFAYLLSDNNTIDELKLQYDAPGHWVEAKPTEYDVIYASNSLMQVKLYLSGDVKINY
jgi:hypothetical protein